MATDIRLEFADGEYRFALGLAQIEELQRKTGTGIGALFARVVKGANRLGEDIVFAPGQAEFHVLDLIETIRQGLIGGNSGEVNGAEVKVSPALANRLIGAYVYPNRPLSEAWEMAVSILGACVIGYNPPGESGPPVAAETTTAG